jgi:hypothetical protein
MGYDSGNIIGNMNENGKCSDHEGSNHCGKAN